MKAQYQARRRVSDKYEEIARVMVHDSGIPVELKLQIRRDQPPIQYYCLSWRTRYESARGKSRRFYSSSNDGFWTIPVSVALCLLREAADRGILSSLYDDLRLRDGSRWNTVIDSRALTSVRLQAVQSEIICSEGEPEWGDSPLFLVSHDEGADWAWRDIMIVDSYREFCTFRCTTTMSEYKMGIFAERLAGPWRLDNALQDASAASMREFLRVLEEISP